jgi:hypothetical protein
VNENLQLALTLFLIHAAWQGIVIAALVAAADKVLHKASPTVRYRLFFLALLFMLLAPALTSLSGVPAAARANAIRIPPDRVSSELAAATPRSAVVSGPKAEWLETIEVSTQYVVPFWMIGVFAMTLRWAGASYVLRRRVRRSSPAGEHWREIVDNLCRALQIGRAAPSDLSCVMLSRLQQKGDSRERPTPTPFVDECAGMNTHLENDSPQCACRLGGSIFSLTN